MRRLPNSLLLSVVDWDVFGTLTWRTEPSLHGAIAAGLEWLELVRQRCRLGQENHYWFLRPERGESQGRIHLHVLMRVPVRFRGLFITPPGVLCVGHKIWGRGMTRFRQVEDRLDSAVIYLQKGDTCLSDAYEIEKTSECANGIPSCALIARALLQKSAGEGVAEHSVVPGKSLAVSPAPA